LAKPPVDTVVKACTIASKPVMPKAKKVTAQAMVSAT